MQDNSIYSNRALSAGIMPAGLAEQIASGGPGMSLIIDNSGRLVYYPERFITEFSYNPDLVTTSDFSLSQLLEPIHKDRFFIQLQQSSRSESARKKYGLYHLKNNDGQYATWSIYVSPVQIAEQDTAQYFHLFMLPESSNQEVPFLSSDSRELFLEQFKQANFGSFEWMIESDQVFWSDGIYNIYEVDKQQKDLNYEFISNFTHPDDSKKAKAAVKRAVESGGDFNVEIKIVTPAGNVKMINAVGHVQTEAAKPVKLVGSIRDITRQRQIEQDLKRNVAELNRSNKELEEFAYVASHDLQEPLRKITTFCGRLAEKYADSLTGEAGMYMERIMASAENMRSLINNLLEFSRITRDTKPFEEISLNFVLHQVKSELELYIEETGAVINSQPLPTIQASLSQMKQLFSNIISNAIKFRRPGEKPVINIEASTIGDEEKQLYALSPTTDYYKIIISDNGIGFENEYALRIFQIFQRLHGKAEYPGSGIGLAICKKIVNHHQGVIFAEGEAGVGARFIIILPAKR